VKRTKLHRTRGEPRHQLADKKTLHRDFGEERSIVTYVIYSFSQILPRWNAAGMTHIRSKGHIVSPASAKPADAINLRPQETVKDSANANLMTGPANTKTDLTGIAELTAAANSMATLTEIVSNYAPTPDADAVEMLVDRCRGSARMQRWMKSPTLRAKRAVSRA